MADPRSDDPGSDDPGSDDPGSVVWNSGRFMAKKPIAAVEHFLMNGKNARYFASGL
jgi:hypothetical protein